MEFLRGLLGFLGMAAAFMTGRSAVAVRKGWQKPSKLYGWTIRTLVCVVAVAFRLGRQLPVGRSPTQLMDYRTVSFPPQLAQESPHLSLRDADLLGGLLLGDQFPLGLLQGHQPVSLGLGHQ